MPVKLVLVMRTDLGMGRGKIAAQAAHAAVTAALANLGTGDFGAWLGEGQPKVVLKVASGAELAEVARRAQGAGLPVTLIQDAGRTQVSPGTPTCCAVGPAQITRIDEVTADLPLL